MFNNKIYIYILFLFFATSVLNANQIKILSSVEKDKNIENAKVTFQRTGQASTSTKSNINGIAKYTALLESENKSNTTMLIEKEGYSTLITKCPCDGFTYALSPIMDSLYSIRIVLTWGNNVKDLDAHLIFPSNDIFWDNKKGDGAILDLDSTKFYGPETITIEKLNKNQKYVYAVHNFSHRKLSVNSRGMATEALTKSNATVRVYIGKTLIHTYKVKHGPMGNVWVVFGIDENGIFQDINKYLMTDRYKDVKKDILPFLKNTQFTTEENTYAKLIKKSYHANINGEKAYHKNHLTKAMYFFQDAINLDHKNGRAYSNLGLTYEKLGRNSEAIYENKRAIKYAKGKNKNSIKASSYYNIARIYEAKNNSTIDALNYYKKALNEKENKAYHDGIERMQNIIDESRAKYIADYKATSTVSKGKKLYKTCAACHGQKGERKALGKSKIINTMNKKNLLIALKGYKLGTYGGPMKGLMKGQVSKISNSEIESLVLYISSLKNN